MANYIFKDETIKIDNASASLTDITAYCTSLTVNGSQDLIEDTGMSDEEKSFLFGQAGATLSLAGILNSTTDAIFNVLIGNRTTATKTFQHTMASGKVLRGEFLNTAVETSGATNSLQTWSYSATLDGVMIKTSVAL
jgi:hypothetical protein